MEDIKQKYEERAKLREKNNEEDIEDKREDFESKRVLSRQIFNIFNRENWRKQM